MSKISRRNRDYKYKTIGDHHKFLSRIKKTLYYGKLPKTDTLSLPVTELSAELFSEAQSGRSLDILHCHEAAVISRNACVSPCSLVLALLYLERLKACNPDYLQRVAPSELFLVSLMISNKFLNDDGECDEVFIDEWAQSGGIAVEELVKIEKDFLAAINWEIFVGQEAFWTRLKALETTLAQRQGSCRGWFTYTELQNLLELIDVYALINCVTSFSLILIATYTAGILSILGSVHIVNQIPGNYLTETKTNAIANETKFCPVVLNGLIIDNNETFTKPLDAVDVLKTSIFLASISVPRYKNCNDSLIDDNPEEIKWDWWNNSLMRWLSETSQVLQDFACFVKFEVSFRNRYFEMATVESNKMSLRDHIDKAISVRLQDQMEGSWHKEWTDRLQKGLGCFKLLTHCLQGFKF